MAKSMKEKAVLKRASELKYPTDRLGPGSLMVQQSHINSSRLIMSNHQLTHMVNIKDPESPLVPSGFENVLAQQSSVLDYSDGDYEIVAKFERNAYNYIIIGYDKKRKVYHAWKRVELMEHQEGFATRYNNSYMDSLEVGDTVPKGKLVKKSESFDKYGNYGYGKNLNTVYMISTMVHEDGLAVMNGAEHMMDMYRQFTVTIPVNDNEILLNWYGDEDHYQALPNIGEKTRKGFLAAVRTVDHVKAPYSLKKKRLRKMERGDRRYPVSGRVIDIDILYNKDESKLIDVKANEQINKLYTKQQKLYKEIYKYMINIVDGAYDGGYTYTDEFSIICESAHDYVDASAFFADNNDNVFGNMMIKVTLMDEEPLYVGSKLVGRAGNKGVISEIVKPEDSWHMEDGRPVHVVMAALGVVGRLNPAQLNEHSINDLSRSAVKMMKSTDDLDDKYEIIHSLFDFLNPDEAKAFKKYYKNLDKKQREKFFKKAERDGIIIVQDPVDNANIADIAAAYEHFTPDYQRLVFPDGTKSLYRVICSPLFFMRLKQDPLEKYSVRYRGPINPLTMLPAKSNQKKRYLEQYSDVAVRFGAQELEVLLTMCNHSQAIADYMAEASTSWGAKVELARQGFLGDPDEPIVSPEEVSKGKKNIEYIEAYTNILGSKFNIEVERAPEGEEFDL